MTEDSKLTALQVLLQALPPEELSAHDLEPDSISILVLSPRPRT